MNGLKSNGSGASGRHQECSSGASVTAARGILAGRVRTALLAVQAVAFLCLLVFIDKDDGASDDATRQEREL